MSSVGSPSHHAKRANELLMQASTMPTPQDAMVLVASAQVHATLALIPTSPETFKKED